MSTTVALVYTRAAEMDNNTAIAMHDPEKICSKCGHAKVKNWSELTDEQKMLVKSLPASAEYPLSRRKMHRFCTRCWYERTDWESSKIA